jgi:hypothetical protein
MLTNSARQISKVCCLDILITTTVHKLCLLVKEGTYILNNADFTGFGKNKLTTFSMAFS